MVRRVLTRKSFNIFCHQSSVILSSRVEIGDMGSIVFPASWLMVDWLRELDRQSPTVLQDKKIVGNY